jgi:hypothetical protein
VVVSAATGRPLDARLPAFDVEGAVVQLRDGGVNAILIVDVQALGSLLAVRFTHYAAIRSRKWMSQMPPGFHPG